MTIQGDIEAQIGAELEAAIVGAVIVLGPITTPRAEGSARVASVRRTTSTGARLEFAQTEWLEQFALTVFWDAASISRATSQAEWEAFELSIAQSVGLGITATQRSIEEAWLAATQWGEAADGHFRTMSATLAVRRVE